MKGKEKLLTRTTSLPAPKWLYPLSRSKVIHTLSESICHGYLTQQRSAQYFVLFDPKIDSPQGGERARLETGAINGFKPVGDQDD